MTVVSECNSTEPKFPIAVSTGLSKDVAKVLELDHPALLIISTRFKTLALQLDVEAALPQ